MPFKKAKDAKLAHRRYQGERYRTDAAFRRKESKRKALWYAEKAQDPAWLAKQAARKRELRALARRRASRRR